MVLITHTLRNLCFQGKADGDASLHSDIESLSPQQQAEGLSGAFAFCKLGTGTLQSFLRAFWIAVDACTATFNKALGKQFCLETEIWYRR